MTVISSIDPIVTVETLMNELLQKGFQNETVRRYLGLSRISQGCTEEGLPFWYIWLSDRKGAFSLAMQEAEPRLSVSEGIGNSLMVRYYPDLDEPIFDSLSCYEQILRLGNFFDATGTPTFEGGPSIPERFFTVGRIDVVMRRSRSDVDFYCSAPNLWREFRSEGLSLVDNAGESRSVLKPGELDRNFPGWELSFHLFSKIVAIFCFLTNLAPGYIGAASRSYKAFTVDADETIKPVVDDQVFNRICGVSLPEFKGHDESGTRVALFKRGMQSGDFSHIEVWENLDDIPASLKIPAWWTIREYRFHTDCDHLCACYQ